MIGDVRGDLNLGTRLGGLVMHLDDALLDLAVVGVQAAVLEGVQERLLNVVDVPALPVRRVHLDLQVQRPFQTLDPEAGERGVQRSDRDRPSGPALDVSSNGGAIGVVAQP